MHRLSVMDHCFHSHNNWSEHKAHSNSGKLCDHSSLVVCLRHYKQIRPAKQVLKPLDMVKFKRHQLKGLILEFSDVFELMFLLFYNE